MQSLSRAVRAAGRIAISRRYVLSTVGSAGASVSAVAVHARLAEGEGHRALCSAATSAAPPAVGVGDGKGNGEGKGRHLEKEDIVIYQYKICPFCNKIKAVMDYLGITYRVTEVNPITKKEIKFSEDYKKVPIMHMGGEPVKDSPIIIEALLSRLREAGGMSEEEHAIFCSPDAEKWAKWADTKLAVLLFPNITRNFSESYQAFTYVRDVGTFSFVDKASNQLLGAIAMWAAQGKIKKKYGIDDEREALFKALKEWTDALEVAPGPFIGGEKPNLGDLCVFGCIVAIEGLDTHRDVLARDGVGPWYTRMKAVLNY